MRHRFLLLSVAIAATAPAAGVGPAQAKQFLDLPAAQAVAFPDAQFTPHHFTLDRDQVAKVIGDSRAPVINTDVKVWKVSTGGWFFLDQVYGLDDRITYALALDETGAVTRIEILECAEGYEAVRDQEWLSGFYGARYSTSKFDVESISGSSLSSEHIKGGVKRLLSTHALFLRDLSKSGRG